MYKVIVVLFLLISMSVPGYGQEATETETDKKEATEEEQVQLPIEEQGFINYGLLSISIGYRITRDGKHIIFKIKNNSGQSIDSLFGWVYKVSRDTGQNGPKVVLVNNPNISGILLSKPPHKSFTIGTWRFTLRRLYPPENVDYVLRVNDRSVFYVPYEYPEPITTITPEEEG